jgi:hypothetical protein
MKRPNRRQLVILLFALLPGLAAAAYRWVDQDGNVQFTQFPPPSDAPVEVEQVKTVKDPRPEQETREEGKDEDVPPPPEMKEEGPTEEEKKAQRELDRKNCNAAKANLSSLQSNPRIKMKDKDGNVGFIGDAKRQNMIDQARKQVRKYCR